MTDTPNDLMDDDDDEMDLAHWPNCATPDCENKACLWGGTGRCHPCSVVRVGAAEMSRRYRETRKPGGAEWNGSVADG